MFQVGQKIVCVDANWNHPDGKEPKQEEIVIISELGDDVPNTIYLQEYPVNANGNRQYFRTYRFRPLSDWSRERTEEITNELEKEILKRLEPQI